MKRTNTFESKLLILAPGPVRSLGAEQQDILAIIDILKGMRELSVVVVWVNQIDKVLALPEVKQMQTDLVKKKRDFVYNIVKILVFKIFGFDRGMLNVYSFSNALKFINWASDHKFNIVLTINSNTFFFGKLIEAYHLHRSHNFEPLHVLHESDRRLGKYVSFWTKFIGVLWEKTAECLLPISNYDSSLYNIFPGRSKSHVLPLTFLKPVVLPLKNISNSFNIAFMGSTYNVKHNLASLNLLLGPNGILSLKELNLTMNIYGAKIPTDLSSDNPNLCIKGWARDKKEIFEENEIFVVPNFGGMGMKSKVFEPLVYGRIVITHPICLADFPFKPWIHYIPIEDNGQIAERIKWISENKEKAISICTNAYSRCEDLFTPERVHDILTGCIRESN